MIALRAVIAGADSWGEVEAFGQTEHNWLKTFLAMPNGIPSHDTFYGVFSRPDPDSFGACVAEWMGAVRGAAGLRRTAIDGKAVRSAPRDTFSGCPHLVSACGGEAVDDAHGRHGERYTTVIDDPVGCRRSGRTWRRWCWSDGSGR